MKKDFYRVNLTWDHGEPMLVYIKKIQGILLKWGRTEIPNEVGYWMLDTEHLILIIWMGREILECS